MTMSDLNYRASHRRKSASGAKADPKPSAGCPVGDAAFVVFDYRIPADAVRGTIHIRLGRLPNEPA